MLDKKLFKALRAGGLGHAAAALLADHSSRYQLGRVQPYEADDYYDTLELSLGAVALSYIYGDTHQRAVFLPSPVLVPMTAGSALKLDFTTQAAAEDSTAVPDGAYIIDLLKVADANGIPVVPVPTTGGAVRTAGVLSSLTAVTNGWTFSASTDKLVATQATAGHYLVTSAQFRRSLAPA